MGYDLTLYPKRATRKELKNFIEELGFKPFKDILSLSKSRLNYYWFEQKDFLSITGVDVYIDPIENNKINHNWSLSVRSQIFASIFDVKMMNKVLREGRRRFGGDIYRDYGKNRYIQGCCTKML